MARYAVAYAHAFGIPADDRPLAVVAQDDQGVALEAVPQNVIALATSLDLPSQTFVAWTEAKRQAIMPIFERDGAELAVTDPQWLERFIQSGYEGTSSFGPVQETTGTAADVAKQQALALKPQG